MTYRLAIDMGATSLGWCVLGLDPRGNVDDILDLGVRIFPDGRDSQSKEPLAVSRRGARGGSRRRDRYLKRRKALMRSLVAHEMMPKTKNEQKELEGDDPYKLRAKAVNEKISLYELGRVLFHINQRRGFKSNRKTDSRGNEGGAIKSGIAALEQAMMETNSKTLGEYLWDQHKNDQGVLARPEAKGQKNEYDFYPSRDMYEQEVDEILKKQKEYHSEYLTDDVCKEIKHIIFYQRPLKPQPVGWCTFESEEKRARLADPAVQKFRILQEINNLEIDSLDGSDPQLTENDRQKIISALSVKKKMTFGQIKKLLQLADGTRFNLEAENRKELNGDDTNALLAHKDCFGSQWYDFREDQQRKIVDLLMDEPDPEKVIETLVRDYDVSLQQAEKICDAPLKDGYGRLSLKAIQNILPGLERGLKYHEACIDAGYHHADFRTGEMFDKLPYYGEVLQTSVIGGSYAEQDKDQPEKFYGKINNPTVHIALNQLRKLVNALIDIYGHPHEVSIELARELKYGQDHLKEINKKQAENRNRNERINAELEQLGVRPTYENRAKYKLWEDLAEDPTKRCCPFTGKQIGVNDIFSGEFEIEHLLPFSRSYNDSMANKVLSDAKANRFKGNKSPYEAFGHSPQGYDWCDIIARIGNLPREKQWRFKEDAWDIAKGNSESIIARQLTDTQYMTRIARRYVSFVVPQDKGESHVYGIPGQLTALVRRKWGLNNIFDDDSEVKDRTNHRHHAIDAFVVGCTSRSMLQAVSSVNEDDREKIKIPEPFDGFRDCLFVKANAMVISYKPDHGNAHKAIQEGKTVAGLHQETAYGYVGEGAKKGTKLYVTRKAVSGFTKRKDIEAVADPVWKAKLLHAVEGESDNSKEFKAALERFSKTENVRRFRVHVERSPDTMIPVYQRQDKGNPEAQPYKYYSLGGNDRAEIYCPDKGKKAGQWQMEIISNYHAHQKGFIPQWQKDNPTAKLIMRLCINDMVAYDEGGVTQICKLKKMTSGKVYLRDHRIAAEEADKLSWAASAAQLQKKNARKISVDITGRIKDSGGKKAVNKK